MAALFSVAPGYAISVRESRAAPLLLGLTDWGDIASGGGFATMRSIITGISVQDRPAFQLRQSLNKFIYGVIFGDEPGALMVSGLSFTGICNGGGAAGGMTETGFDKVRDYYQQHKISRRLAPVVVVVGGSSFGAFLVGCDLRIDNPQAGITSFGLAFSTLPDTR